MSLSDVRGWPRGAGENSGAARGPTPRCFGSQSPPGGEQRKHPLPHHQHTSTTLTKPQGNGICNLPVPVFPTQS